MVRTEQIIAFLGVSLIIIFQYASYSYFILNLISFVYPNASLILFTILSILVLMIFWTYSFAVFKNPGQLYIWDIPKNYTEAELDEAKTKSVNMKEKMKLLNQKLRIFSESKSAALEPIGNLSQEEQNANKKVIKRDQKSLILDEERGMHRLEVDGSGSLNSLSVSSKQVEREINNLLYENIDKRLFCFLCDLLKLERSRHCKKCKCCIQRFDHHCPWTGNCVGKYNHKFFVQFLFYASFTLLSFAIVQVSKIKL